MKGIKKLPLAAAIAVLSASANAELVALDEETMDSMTGQAGITIEADLQVSIGETLYVDSDGADAASAADDVGRLRIQNLQIGNNGGAISLTQTLNVIDASEAVTSGAQNAAGDVIALGITDMTADVTATLATGTVGDIGTIGDVAVNDLSLAGGTTYIYAVDGSNSIGIDQQLKASVGSVTFTDTDGVGGTAGLYNIAIHDGSDGTINLTGMELTVIEDNGVDKIKITQPTLTGQIDIGAIVIGTPEGASQADFLADLKNKAIGSATLRGLDMSGSDIFVYADTGETGIRIDQSMKVSLNEATYVADSLDGLGANRNNDGVGSITLAGVEVNAGTINGENVYMSTTPGQTVEWDGTQWNEVDSNGQVVAAYSGDPSTDGLFVRLNVDHERADAIQLTGMSIDVASSATLGDQIVIGAPSLQGNINVNSINVGANSLGSVIFSDINMAGTTTRIYAN